MTGLPYFPQRTSTVPKHFGNGTVFEDINSNHFCFSSALIRDKEVKKVSVSSSSGGFFSVYETGAQGLVVAAMLERLGGVSA
jgi:hypothetical protein